MKLATLSLGMLLLLGGAHAHAETTAAPISPADLTTPEAQTDARLFKDTLFSGLRPGVTASAIAGMKTPFLRTLAESMLKGEHRGEYRLAKAEAYRPLDDLSKEFKTGHYNRFENPVGINYKTGDIAVVFVGETGAEKLELVVQSFAEAKGSQTYPLNKGVNIITMKEPGNAYLKYFTPNYAKAHAIPVHFASGGAVQGVFDATRHTNADWKRLLASDDGEILDIKGKYVNLAYHIPTLRKTCPDRGLELITLYDSIIDQQQSISGLVKYDRRPKNHMFGRVIWKGFMHADGFGAAFHNNTMKNVASVHGVQDNAWGIAHEFGHVGQVRPGMKWVSTTEVTNNIYSAWTNFKLNPASMRLEHERCDANDGNGNVEGGRFNCYLNAAVVAGEQWLCQYGPDKRNGYENGGDHFVKLCPLWQLQLYFGEAGLGNRDFYPDIFEIVRKTNETKLSNGRLQLNFMKNACDVTKQDLTDFFRTAGMLKPIDKDMDDYSRAQLTITEAECAELAAYAKRYTKPASPVIHYISANSVQSYAKRLSVSGTTEQGVKAEGNTRTIDHKNWKNAVAYETYAGAKLIKVVIAGTGSKDNTSTRIPYPEDATRIEAVAWNGKRTLVTGKR